MKLIKQPRAIFLAESKLDEDGECEFLTEIGAHVVDPDGMGDTENVELWETDAPSDGERLTEHAGRMCYRSHNIGLNANITNVRKGNKRYMDNILASGHGSVGQHITGSVWPVSGAGRDGHGRTGTNQSLQSGTVCCGSRDPGCLAG